MALTDIAGSGGSITFASNEVGGDFENWSATIDGTVAEYTTFTSAPFPVRKITGVSISGSATGVLQFDAANTAPLANLTEAGMEVASMTLTAETGCTYAGAFVVSQVSIGRPSNGKAEITCNFASNGTITQSWDEGA